MLGKLKLAQDIVRMRVTTNRYQKLRLECVKFAYRCKLPVCAYSRMPACAKLVTCYVHMFEITGCEDAALDMSQLYRAHPVWEWT